MSLSSFLSRLPTMLSSATRLSTSTSAARYGVMNTPFVARPTVAATRCVAAMAASTKKLYVGNLSWETTAQDLADHFGKWGQVEDAFVATDRETGRSRGFGFVTMDTAGGSAAETEANETEFMGRTIRVNEAAPQGERPAGGRGGYGGGRGGGGRGYGGGGRGGGYGGGGGGGRGYGGGGGGRGYGGGGGGGGRGYGGGDAGGGGGGY